MNAYTITTSSPTKFQSLWSANTLRKSTVFNQENSMLSTKTTVVMFILLRPHRLSLIELHMLPGIKFEKYTQQPL